MSSYVREVSALPIPRAGLDILDRYIASSHEELAAFSEQAIAEAERGDVEAALYASSAAEFCRVICDRLTTYRAEAALLTTVLSLAGLRAAGDIARAFLI